MAGPRQGAFYEYGDSFGRSSQWFGRVSVWLPRLPKGPLELVRGKYQGASRLTIQIGQGGTVRANDRTGRTIAATSRPISAREWVRIEWSVDHDSDVVELRIFAAGATIPTEIATSSPGQALGSAVDHVQIGRFGNADFSSAFWTDNPGVSRYGYLGA